MDYLQGWYSVDTEFACLNSAFIGSKKAQVSRAVSAPDIKKTDDERYLPISSALHDVTTE